MRDTAPPLHSLRVALLATAALLTFSCSSTRRQSTQKAEQQTASCEASTHTTHTATASLSALQSCATHTQAEDESECAEQTLRRLWIFGVDSAGALRPTAMLEESRSRTASTAHRSATQEDCTASLQADTAKASHESLAFAAERNRSTSEHTDSRTHRSTPGNMTLALAAVLLIVFYLAFKTR